MKLEKREITLNERDSLRDALQSERALLDRYVLAAVEVDGKERRSYLADFMLQSLQNIFSIVDLLREKEEN